MSMPFQSKGHVMISPVLPHAKGVVALKQNQSGQALMAWVLIMMVLFAGLGAALTGYTVTSINATKGSSDFVIAGQLSNEAVQDAIYEFNEGEIAAFNSGDTAVGINPAPSAGTQCGSSLGDAVLRGATWDNTKLGCGDYQSSPKSGKWQWTVDDTSLGGATERRYQVTATGAYGRSQRSVTVNLTSVSVTGVRYDDEKRIGYTVAPSTVFDFAMFAGSDQTNEGLSWVKGPKAGSNVYVKGAVGSNNLIDLKKQTTTEAASTAYDVPGVGFYNYGGAQGWDARCNTKAGAGTSKSVCEPIIRAPQKMVLNSGLVTSLADQCVGNPYKWVASEQDGTLNAGAGNSGCFTEMVFDRDTNIVGTDFYSAFVSGNVTINPGVNVKTMGTANLVIYTSGNVSLADGGGATLKELDMFVYAPKGTCALKNTQADVSPVEVEGSLACNKVDLSGVSVKWKAAPRGVDQPGFSNGTAPDYARKIWNADNIVEGPSGRLS
jgi:hypothetical protein